MVPKTILSLSLLAAGVLLAAIFPFPCRAQGQGPERSVTSLDQKGVTLTVYKGNLALVTDRRRVTLSKGENRLAWEEVSAKMQPETALLSDPGHPDAVNVLEQNFDFDLLTPQKLLEKYVGRTVQVIRTNPATGEESRESAKVLSAAGGVVLKIGDRIETGIPGRLVYPDVPPDLRDRPTLGLLLHSAAGGPQDLELSYLTTGLSWKADYVAELNPGENRMQLSGRATLTNSSGIDYRAARVQLVAGKVNRVSAGEPRPVMFEAVRAKAAAPMPEESFFDYHLYTLPRAVTLRDNQSKQTALLEAADIPVVREYMLRGSGTYYQTASPGSQGKASVGVYLKFRNDAKSGLGQPLPAGVLRVYQSESAGNARFVGEDRIDPTPRDGQVQVLLGEAFDVTAERRQTDFKRLAGTGRYTGVFESAYRIELKNAKNNPVKVTVVEPVPGDWEIVEENHPHE
ncbi:MAG: DUF4139 domain-containing protein, partial [Desulfuromonadales bacterium]